MVQVSYKNSTSSWLYSFYHFFAILTNSYMFPLLSRAHSHVFVRFGLLLCPLCPIFYCFTSGLTLICTQLIIKMSKLKFEKTNRLVMLWRMTTRNLSWFWDRVEKNNFLPQGLFSSIFFNFSLFTGFPTFNRVSLTNFVKFGVQNDLVLSL